MADAENGRTVKDRVARNGREYISYSDGTSFTRRLDRVSGQPISDWTEVERTVEDNPLSAPDPVQPRYLMVIAEHQAENEPKHWSLFSHVPNAMGAGPGQMWQVTGDAEFMHFEQAAGVDRMSSPDFAWHQVLSQDLSDEQLARVEEIVRTEKPPSAPNRASVKEHCQGWTVRVVKRLVDEGIVQREGVVEMLEGYMDPIRN
ncbi:hypothetical protein C8A05DRAFT_43968 [Staphylotrichum tortipilum]|uniref:Uncharacterized protein n=1 Tax=Staphylotrichum tortipilum TaxID=2831512 RepID=A0AAN6MLZ2_9PEZI|nr:hypothetical protein C8A05DRAFT_43968 [Staphylotrichum longicolle]